jgi:hypothetical protein
MEAPPKSNDERDILVESAAITALGGRHGDFTGGRSQEWSETPPSLA